MASQDFTEVLSTRDGLTESMTERTMAWSAINAGSTKRFQLVKKAGGALGIGIDWVPTGGCRDGNNLAEAGLPNVDTFGVVGGMIHSDKDYTLRESFVWLAKLSKPVMLLLASGEAPWPKRLDT